MWLIKHKPRTFEDYKYHSDIINIIKGQINDIKNMLFFGPPGSGKTTLSDIIVSSIYNEKGIKYNVLKLNASDERGITVIRNKLTNFCTKTVYGKYDFKIIILDEADMLTYESQTALRKIMEDYPNTKFILICNYENKIINPLVSRCLKLYFPKINKDYLRDYLKNILIKEGINVKNKHEKIIKIIIDYTNGDLRKSIILLESLYHLNITDMTKKLKEVLGIIEIKDIDKFMKSITNSNMFKKIGEFNSKSWSLNIFMDKYKEYILNNNSLKDDTRKKIFIKLSDYDNMLFNNTDKDIILLNIFSDFIN